MQVSFELKAQFPVSAATLYHAWLDSKIHTAMIGVVAKKANPFRHGMAISSEKIQN